MNKKAPTKDTTTKDTIQKTKQFECIWNKYPRKLGKKESKRHFDASIKTDEDFKNIQIALEHYLESKDVLKGFIQHGKTWFNNWQDWIRYEEKICSKCKGRGKFTSKTGYEIICDCLAGK